MIKLLLKTSVEVDETDAEGNSALHCSLKASMASVSKQIRSSSLLSPVSLHLFIFISNTDRTFISRVIWLLLEHGARVSHKNKLGLNAVHIAAANGNPEALHVCSKS